jgi:asparagine synthase (glutamine-hydrolysing)
MIKSMKHRGPDANEVKIINNNPILVFGHTRLSIIDLSHDSDQPMSDPLTGNSIIFNGEIYNFKILKTELEALGHNFRTNSDTEVILKSYSEWGERCCNKLRGIFAFALWDNKNKKLFVARDPIGVKPFYYFKSEGLFLFASEVRALLESGLVPRKLDHAGLESYLAYGSVQEPLTMIKGVKSLTPGYYAYFDFIKGLETTRYWIPSAEKKHISEYEITETVNEKLRETAKLQLVSDVPIGIFLSGGIDSSAIVSLVRRVYEGTIKTFSIVFEDPKYDERLYSKMVAERNCTEHTELELSSSLIINNLNNAINDFDQPSLDGLNTWFVSKLVKEAGLTVALSGVGGDELFVGYSGFKKALLMQRMQPLLSVLPATFGSIIQKSLHKEQIRRIGDMMGFKYPGYFMSRKLFSAYQRTLLLDKSFERKENWLELCYNEVISDANNFGDELTCISYYELRTYMLSTLLRDADQMSMAHSLEVRVPLIDPEVVKLLLSLPGNVKKSKETPKPLLVHAAGTGLPHECVYRKKQGFSFPFDQYFRESLGVEMLEFFNETRSAVFEKNELYNLWTNYQSGKISWSRVWSIFVLAWWMKKNNIDT